MILPLGNSWLEKSFSGFIYLSQRIDTDENIRLLVICSNSKPLLRYNPEVIVDEFHLDVVT